MPAVGIRDLSRHISRYIDAVVGTGNPVVVTKHGRPVAAIVALDEEGVEELVLAHASEFVLGMRAADEEDARGETKPLDEVLAEIDGEEAVRDADAPPRD